jgi:sugar phosphate permease
VNLSVAIVQLAKEQSWTLEQQSYALSAFFPGYVLTQVAGSIFAGKFGGPVVLGSVVFAWSTITLATPIFAADLHSLYIIRFALGLAEGMAVPAIYHIISSTRYVDQKDHGVVISALALGNQIGAMLGFLLCPAIIKAFNWAAIFYFFGILGYIWLFMWLITIWHETGAHARKKEQLGHRAATALEAGQPAKQPYKEAIYSHADGTKEHVQVVKEHPYGEGGGFTIFVASLQRERQTVEERLDFAIESPYYIEGPCMDVELNDDIPLLQDVLGEQKEDGHAKAQLSLSRLGCKMLTEPSSMVLFVSHFSLGCAHFVTLTWMPTYFSERWGMQQGTMWIM